MAIGACLAPSLASYFYNKRKEELGSKIYQSEREIKEVEDNINNDPYYKKDYLVSFGCDGNSWAYNKLKEKV